MWFGQIWQSCCCCCCCCFAPSHTKPLFFGRTKGTGRKMRKVVFCFGVSLGHGSLAAEAITTTVLRGLSITSAKQTNVVPSIWRYICLKKRVRAILLEIGQFLSRAPSLTIFVRVLTRAACVQRRAVVCCASLDFFSFFLCVCPACFFGQSSHFFAHSCLYP